MKKKLAGILSAVAAWLLLLSMLLTGVFICTTSRAYYRHEYQKYGQAQNIGIDDDGLMRITNALLDYLWGSRDSLDMQAEINGQLREVFTQREKDHMVDVRALVSLARIVMVASFVLGVGLWIAAARIGKKDKGGIRASGIGYLLGELLLIVAVGIVVVLAMQDFNAVFIKFHQIFFTNDLWLLNADDMLILMVPEPFFADCAALIAIVFGIGALITSVIAILMTARDGHKRDKGEDWKLTAVDGGDGDSFYRIDPSEAEEDEDLDASEIFARLGLSDEEESDEEETVPVDRLKEKKKEPEGQMQPVQQPAAVPEAVSNQCFFDLKSEDRDLRVRLDMTMDLRVSRGQDGQVSLTMDPDCKPKITLTSAQGKLSSDAELSEGVGMEQQKPIMDAPIRVPAAALEPAPSPEELLRQMDELMQGFPKNKEEQED